MAAILPKMQGSPVARMTTTFTESYHGVYGPPALSTRLVFYVYSDFIGMLFLLHFILEWRELEKVGKSFGV